jgi:hypothetical protein
VHRAARWRQPKFSRFYAHFIWERLQETHAYMNHERRRNQSHARQMPAELPKKSCLPVKVQAMRAIGLLFVVQSYPGDIPIKAHARKLWTFLIYIMHRSIIYILHRIEKKTEP